MSHVTENLQLRGGGVEVFSGYQEVQKVGESIGKLLDKSEKVRLK